MRSFVLIHPTVWPQETWTADYTDVGKACAQPAPVNFECWAAMPLSVGELDSHLTQCGRGRGLPACQVLSSSVQTFGYSTPKSQTAQDRTEQTDRTTVDRTGRTVLQTVAQKLQFRGRE